MNNPITWRNINAPNFAGVQQGLASGGQSITNGLNTLANAAQSVADNENQAFNDQRDFNTQQLLNQIAGTTDTTGVSAARGDITGQLENLGGGVDANRVLASLDTRGNTLRANEERAEDRAFTTQTREEDRARTLLQRDRADDQTNQVNSAASIIRSVVSDVDNENDVEATLVRRLQEAGVRGNNLTNAVTDGLNAFARSNTLGSQAQADIARLEEQEESILVNATRRFETEKTRRGLDITPDEQEAFSDRTTEAEAIARIGDNSGESGTLSNDRPGILSNGVQGRENGIEFAGRGIQNVKNELINELSNSPGNESLVRELTGDGLPGIVVNRAFDATPRDEDGEWDFEQFQNNLRSEWGRYINSRNKQLASLEYDENVVAAGLAQLRAQSRNQIQNRIQQERAARRAGRRLENLSN